MFSGMRLTLQPHERYQHGQVHTYCVELPDGEKAVLTIAPGRGWHLEIMRTTGQTLDRGLFARPSDALAVLQAEYYPPGHPLL